MLNRRIIVTFIAALVIGVITYMLYPVAMPNETVEYILQAPSVDGEVGSLKKVSIQGSSQDVPPPPPARDSDSSQIREPQKEVPRTLSNTTAERLAQIEQYLPEGGRVYVNAVSRAYQKAAFSEVDIDRDGITETVVVFSERQLMTKEQPRLKLGIIIRAGNERKLDRVVSLSGNVLFNVKTDSDEAPLIIRDMTGDGYPETVIAPGGGASVGGSLEIFSTDGGSFSKVAENIYGHFFTIESNGSGFIVKARSKDDNEVTAYNWDGKRFKQMTK